MPDSNITKRALADAIKQLMEEQPFSKISVGDLCRQCGMNRKSFYYHFRDKYDLVDWIFESEFLGKLKLDEDADGWRLLAELCGYLYEKRAFYRNAMEIEGQNSFCESFFKTIKPLLQVMLEDLCPEPDSDEEQIEFTCNFLMDAFWGSLVRWLRESEPAQPEAFVGRLNVVMRYMAQAAERKRTKPDEEERI